MQPLCVMVGEHLAELCYKFLFKSNIMYMSGMTMSLSKGLVSLVMP